MMMRPARMAAVVLALAACTRSAANHEELGDRQYAAGAYRDALAEYELGLKADPNSASLHAKTAAAALHTEDYELAATQYRALAAEDRSREEEAANGLERVVRAATEHNDRSALTSALVGLREITPRRPLGRYASLVALDAAQRGDTADAVALLPMAIAAAPDARTADSLLLAYGMVAVRMHDCSTAVAVFQGIIRRQRAPDVVDEAREGLGLCALVQGQLALERGKPAEAEEWFRLATAPGSAVDVTRAAFLGLGDVRLAQGDVTAALESYQQALAGGAPGDTIAQRARERINALGKADAP